MRLLGRALAGAFIVATTCQLVGSIASSQAGSLLLRYGSPRDAYRSPMDLVVLPDGKLALTANHSSDSVSVIDLASSRVLAELPCGRKPVSVACSPDGTKVAVSNLWSGSLSLFELANSTLRPLGQVALGPMPRALVFGPNGQSVFVSLAAADEVIQFDWPTRRITRRWPAPREPRRLALSLDGRLLTAASSRSAQVRCWDTQSGELIWERKIEDGFNLRGLAFMPDGQGVVCTHSVRRSFPVSKANIEEGWVIDSRLTRFALEPKAIPPTWQLALDTRGKAIGDPDDLVYSDDGRLLALAGSGTHEVALLDAPAIPWNSGDPGDFLDWRVTEQNGKIARILVAGRPLTMRFIPGTSQLIIANHLLDAVQIVDTKRGELVRTIPLGGPVQPNLERQGEALFYNARLSHHQWFSCNSCHVEGHTCLLSFDTLNDDSYGNPKLTPTLRHVAATGPWTWHGWQKDLGAAVRKSLMETMFGPEPAADDVRALVAYLGTLEHPPNPHRAAPLNPSAERGKAIFHGKARCARCHQGENYTSKSNYDVHLEPDGSPYPHWNPPSLLGLWDRGPFLHDGRASNLEELLDKHHGSEKLEGQPLTPNERQDLLEFLKSL
jgi:YVTN family beta-propeller protein